MNEEIISQVMKEAVDLLRETGNYSEEQLKEINEVDNFIKIIERTIQLQKSQDLALFNEFVEKLKEMIIDKCIPDKGHILFGETIMIRQDLMFKYIKTLAQEVLSNFNQQTKFLKDLSNSECSDGEVRMGNKTADNYQETKSALKTTDLSPDNSQNINQEEKQ